MNYQMVSAYINSISEILFYITLAVSCIMTMATLTLLYADHKMPIITASETDATVRLRMHAIYNYADNICRCCLVGILAIGGFTILMTIVQAITKFTL